MEQTKEWDRPSLVLVSKPDLMYWGTAFPLAESYECPPHQTGVLNQFNDFLRFLTTSKIKYAILRDIVLEGDDTPLRREVEKLISSGRLVKYETEDLENVIRGFTGMNLKEWQKYLVENSDALSLFNFLYYGLEGVVFTSPKEARNNGIEVEYYKVRPLTNLMFMRDQSITLPEGVVIGKMNNGVRVNETILVKIMYEKLGVKILGEVTGKGRLEGGDFIALYPYALIGNGLRTNFEGIWQLINNDFFRGFEYVAIVKDERRKQDEMHLDTWFGVVGEKKFIVLEDRLEFPNIPYVYIHRPNGTLITEMPLPKFLDRLKSEGFDYRTITKQHQLKYGANVLCIGEDEVVVAGELFKDSMSYARVFNELGVKPQPINSCHINAGYGGWHCITQVGR